MANVKKTRQRFKWNHETWHFLSPPKAIEPRDQLRPGSYLHQREDPGNEVVKVAAAVNAGVIPVRTFDQK